MQEGYDLQARFDKRNWSLCRCRLCWRMGSSRLNGCWQYLFQNWIHHLICWLSNLLAKQTPNRDCAIHSWSRIHLVISGSEGDASYDAVGEGNQCYISALSSTAKICDQSEGGQSVLHCNGSKSQILLSNKTYSTQVSSFLQACYYPIKSKWIPQHWVLLHSHRWPDCWHIYHTFLGWYLLQATWFATKLVARTKVMRECEYS